MYVINTNYLKKAKNHHRFYEEAATSIQVFSVAWESFTCNDLVDNACFIAIILVWDTPWVYHFDFIKLVCFNCRSYGISYSFKPLSSKKSHDIEKWALHKKMKFSIKNFLSKCEQILFPADLVTFTEEILNGKLHFLWSGVHYWFLTRRRKAQTWKHKSYK